jgi:predicted RNase H-like nuclease (RuvC/YqgF family)
MKVKRYKVDYDAVSHTIGGVECENGRYVEYKDYEHLSDYCDRLVEVGKLPCLPKDLENLRNANTQFAIENEELKQKNQALEIAVKDLHAQLDVMEDKWESAEAATEEALKLRAQWHGKWAKTQYDLLIKIENIKKQLDNIYNQSY